MSLKGEHQLRFTPLFTCDAKPLIGTYEAAIGARLPDSYRKFLETHNGAFFPKQPRFPVDSPDTVEGDGELSKLYGLSETPDPYDLRESGIGLEFSERVPANIIAIGQTPYHERIALSIAGDDYGAVYLWRPGEPWEPVKNVQTREYLTFVARDFADFWSLIMAQ
jgi:hypothetical protein